MQGSFCHLRWYRKGRWLHGSRSAEQVALDVDDGGGWGGFFGFFGFEFEEAFFDDAQDVDPSERSVNVIGGEVHMYGCCCGCLGVFCLPNS